MLHSNVSLWPNCGLVCVCSTVLVLDSCWCMMKPQDCVLTKLPYRVQGAKPRTPQDNEASSALLLYCSFHPAEEERWTKISCASPFPTQRSGCFGLVYVFWWWRAECVWTRLLALLRVLAFLPTSEQKSRAHSLLIARLGWLRKIPRWQRGEGSERTWRGCEDLHFSLEIKIAWQQASNSVNQWKFNTVGEVINEL